MKTLISKACALSCFVALTSFSITTKAQQNIEALPPIIDYILNGAEPVISPEDNSAPVNFLPLSTAQNPIQIEFGRAGLFLIGTDDIDGNLINIEVTASRTGLLSIELNSEVTIERFQVNSGGSGFVLTGSQAGLIRAITPLTYAPLLANSEENVLVEISITSTDSLGAFDQDSFFVNFINDGNNLPIDPVPIDPDNPDDPIDEIPEIPSPFPSPINGDEIP